MEININYTYTPPQTAGLLLQKDPTKFIKILRLMGEWTENLFSLTKKNSGHLKKIDFQLKQTNSIIKLVLFVPVIITLLSNLSNAKETLLSWLDLSGSSTQKIADVAQSMIANHIAPFFESTADFISTLSSLTLINITPYLSIIQNVGGISLLIMTAYQIHCLVKRYFSGDIQGTFSLEVAKQASTLAIAILSIAAASTTLPFIGPVLLSLSTASLFTSLMISADKIEKQEANRVS